MIFMSEKVNRRKFIGYGAAAVAAAAIAGTGAYYYLQQPQLPMTESLLYIYP